MSRAVLFVCIVTGFVVLAVSPGCDQLSSNPIEPIVSNVQAVGRVATTDALEAEFLAGRLTFEASLERAEAMLETNEPGASLFAGAVLDFAVRIEDRFPTGAEFELFWMRVGQLASKATYQAMTEGRLDEADALVLAGPKRWQRASYWRVYPNHDIMVALSLAHQGQSREGIARLRSRVIVTPEMEAAIEQIQELERARLRDRIRQQIEAEQSGGPGGARPGG